jgi:DNA-directed RNA polymerase specialized sigma24 family protein
MARRRSLDRRTARRSPHQHRDATDFELVALHRDGDATALDSLLRRYRRLRRDSIRRAAHGDDDQAEQLWSDVTLRVLRGIERFDGSQAVSTWLNRIISTVARDELRRLACCPLVYTPAAEDPAAWGPHHPIDVPSFNRSPDEDVFLSEGGPALGAALAAPSKSLGAAVWLSLSQGALFDDPGFALGGATGSAQPAPWRGAKIAGWPLQSRPGLNEEGGAS